MKIGDVVQLKSGGPYMTVIYADSENATCQWFTGEVLARTETFPLLALESI